VFAGNIPESIDVDVTDLDLGESLDLLNSLPEGCRNSWTYMRDKIKWLVSVNAPKAVEEDPEKIEGEEGEEGSDESEGRI
jgi:hypothetical protein